MNLDLRFYLSLFLRRLPYFLVFLAIGSAIGITLATVLPPVYRSEATLLVESQGIALAETNIEQEAAEQLQIIQGQILTRANLTEMANRLGIYADRQNDPERRLNADQIVEDMLERIRITVTGGSTGRDQLATFVVVGFDAPTGQMSQEVTNEIVTMILQEAREIDTTLTGRTLDFYEDQVRTLGQDLAIIDAEILAFQQENINTLPDNRDSLRAEQTAAQERLFDIEREEQSLRDRRQQLIDFFEQNGTLGDQEPQRQLTREEQQLLALENELADLRSGLSATHPRVVALEARVEAAREAAASSVGIATTDEGAPDPQQIQFNLLLAEIEGELTIIEGQKARIEARLTELAGLIAELPATEGELLALERARRNLSDQYDQAVAARNQAQIGDEVVTTGFGRRINMIDPAVVPSEPESPNRPVLAAAGIGGGFVLGLAVVILLELLTSAVRRPADIINKLGITPLSTIPHIRTRWEILRRRLVILGVFALVLIAVPVALWLVHTQVTPLDQLINPYLLRFGLPVL